MSIAVALVLHPSRILRCGLALFLALLGGIFFYMATLGHISFLARIVWLGLLGFAIWRGLVIYQNIAQTYWRLMVDERGQVRCCQAKHPDTSPSFSSSDHSSMYQLSLDSTIWSHSLFLHLTHAQHKSLYLVIMPDMLSQEAFRQLSICCRWLIRKGY